MSKSKIYLYEHRLRGGIVDGCAVAVASFFPHCTFNLFQF